MNVWKMVLEAANELTKTNNGKTFKNQEIRNYIINKYPKTNSTTINCQILSCTVNSPSRVNYSENKRDKIANEERDFLFAIKRGVYRIYDEKIDGIWCIAKNLNGKFEVKKEEGSSEPIKEVGDCVNDNCITNNFYFALESHLRDFLAKNLSTIKENLVLCENGVEYNTDVGRIDILAEDDEDNLYVIELKNSKGTDRVIGQILRYMGWISENVATSPDKVKGIIIAPNINDKLEYALKYNSNIEVHEYKMNFELDKKIG